MFLKVAVLMGGNSLEREISIKSGNTILSVFKNTKINAFPFDTKYEDINILKDLKVSHAFIALHGPGGEDGTLQAQLEKMNISYSGSGPKASAIALNKYACKQMWKQFNVPTLPGILVNRKDKSILEKVKGYSTPFIVKPNNQGSSIGISKVDKLEELNKALEKVWEVDEEALIESFVKAREFSVPIIDKEVLTPVEIDKEEEIFSFDCKYKSNKNYLICPSTLSENEERKCKKIAMDAFSTIGCRGFGRVDMLQDSNGNFYPLEINTIPGLTENSIIVKSALVRGWSLNELVMRMFKTIEDLEK